MSAELDKARAVLAHLEAEIDRVERALAGKPPIHRTRKIGDAIDSTREPTTEYLAGLRARLELARKRAKDLE